MHKIWPERRAHYFKYENLNNSDLEVCHLLPFAKVGQNSQLQQYIPTDGTHFHVQRD